MHPDPESGAIVNKLLAVTLLSVSTCFLPGPCGAQSGGNGSGETPFASNLKALGEYEIKHQIATGLAIKNRDVYLTKRREQRLQTEADHEALKNRRTSQNVQTNLRQLRDAPETNKVASGAALNFLMDELGPELSSVEMTSVTLTTAELASVRLQTSGKITTEVLESTTTAKGKIAWPEELRFPELRAQCDAVEEAYEKLNHIAGQGHAVQTQLKRLEQEISTLRRQAGTLLRVEKRDEIGADASRVFLRHLQCSLVQLGSPEKRNLLEAALHPEVHSASALMQHIATYDLQFAPCDDPTAAAYLKLHDRLAQADRDRRRLARTTQATK